jgi:hypothetical protein
MERRSGWGRQRGQERDRWGDVNFNCRTDEFGDGRSRAGKEMLAKVRQATADSARALLRDSFGDGPEAAARAQAAYRSWVHGVVEVGGSERMPGEARRWSEFHERWDSFLLENRARRFASFSSIDGVDFSRALRRGRSRSM